VTPLVRRFRHLITRGRVKRFLLQTQIPLEAFSEHLAIAGKRREEAGDNWAPLWRTTRTSNETSRRKLGVALHVVYMHNPLTLGQRSRDVAHSPEEVDQWSLGFKTSTERCHLSCEQALIPHVPDPGSGEVASLPLGSSKNCRTLSLHAKKGAYDVNCD
jgi:hypothetical protein